MKKSGTFITPVSVYFIGLFYPDAIRNKTKIHFDIKGIPLRPHRAFWYKKGWEALGKDSDDEDETEDAGTDGFDLSLLKFNDSGLCESADVDKKRLHHLAISQSQRYWPP